MTPAECASGTDRIAWAARRWQADAVVNVQGDEPLLEPEGIRRLVRHLRDHPADPMVTLAAPAEDGDRDDPDVVKVVVDLEGRALYFSRAPVPWPRFPDQAPALRHLGIYGYRRQTLLELADLAPSPLERSEGLEQLRALEHGVPIRVLTGARASPGVDGPDDVEEVERLLAREGRRRLETTAADRGGS